MGLNKLIYGFVAAYHKGEDRICTWRTIRDRDISFELGNMKIKVCGNNVSWERYSALFDKCMHYEIEYLAISNRKGCHALLMRPY